MELIIFLVTLVLTLIIVFGYTSDSHDPNFTTRNIIASIALIILGSLFILTANALHDESKKPIIIQKSSDSDWELSTNNSIKKDTCITRIVIINNGLDTVYPTTCYKILRK